MLQPYIESAISLSDGGIKRCFFNDLKYEIKTSSKSSLDPQKLLVPERAAYFYSLRVHLQVLPWRELANNDLNPEQ